MVSFFEVALAAAHFLSAAFVCSSVCAGSEQTGGEEDRDEVFTVEIRRGPHGLGLALVDGMVRKRRSLLLLLSRFASSSDRRFCFTENAAEDERRLREVGGSGLSGRSEPEAEDGRPHPGGERRQPGGDGLQQVGGARPAERTASSC